MLSAEAVMAGAPADVTSHKFQNLPQKLAEQAQHHRMQDLSFR